MKFNFKQISAVLASTLLVGMTAGVAGAVNYPAPFVENGQANVAVVYGANAASTDNAAATQVASQLFNLAGGSVVGLGSESVQIRGPVKQWHLGNDATEVFTTGALRKGNMPNLLADGSYFDDANNEFKFTQKIELSDDLVLQHFRDTDYSDVPAIGINLNSGSEVLTYTLEFNTLPEFTNTKMRNTDLTLFGKDYFVLSAVNNTLTTGTLELLDAASTTLLNAGETTTLNVGGQSYEVRVQDVSTSGARLVVNGVTTNRLDTGDTYKLPDGSHLGVKDVRQAQFAGDNNYVEFSIGSGKLVLTNDAEVELNEEVINGLKAFVTLEAGKLKSISLEWKTDDREFITPSSELVMPGFGTLKLAMTDFFTPEEERFVVERDGESVRLTNFQFADGSRSLNLVYGNSTDGIQGLGRSATDVLVTSADDTLTYDRTENHRSFVVSYNETAWAESYLLSIPSVVFRDGTNKTTIRNEVTGQNICVEVSPGQTCSVGPIVLTVVSANRTAGDDWQVELTTSAGAGGFNTLYSAGGMKVYLPVLTDGMGDPLTGKGQLDLSVNGSDSGVGHNATAWDLYFAGQNKDGNLAQGSDFKATVSLSGGSTPRLHVGGVEIESAHGGSHRIGDSGDRYESYTHTEVPTRIVHDQTGDYHRAEVTYFGGESYGRVFLSSTDVEGEGSSGEVGNLLVTDAEASSVSNRNLVVVGGSCVNSVAAQLVGGALCGSDWEGATGVGAGQWLIQRYNSPLAANRVALLVAGYNAADTTNAATYLRTQTVDLDRKYVGTTATQAESSVVSQ